MRDRLVKLAMATGLLEKYAGLPRYLNNVFQGAWDKKGTQAGRALASRIAGDAAPGFGDRLINKVRGLKMNERARWAGQPGTPEYSEALQELLNNKKLSPEGVRRGLS